MAEYTLRPLREDERPSMEALLAQEGLKRDAGLDYSCGVFDGESLVATGSCAGNTLRCLAVAKDRQGGGILNRLVLHLFQVQHRRGNYHVFLYTKPRNAPLFADLGFAEIARAGDSMVFLENRKTGFSDYLARLREETGALASRPGRTGALVMNANPFTLGHQYLAQEAGKACGLLHLFVVSEDVSLFPARVRTELVRAGTAHLKNAVLHQTGSYLISRATFPAYFLPDSDAVCEAQARLDGAVFSRIADALGIQVRYLGEEPASAVTRIYNRHLAQALPAAGIQCRILPRKTTPAGEIISASAVRKALARGDWATVEAMVPPSTLACLRSEEGGNILAGLGPQNGGADR